MKHPPKNLYPLPPPKLRSHLHWRAQLWWQGGEEISWGLCQGILRKYVLWSARGSLPQRGSARWKFAGKPPKRALEGTQGGAVCHCHRVLQKPCAGRKCEDSCSLEPERETSPSSVPLNDKLNLASAAKRQNIYWGPTILSQTWK